LGSVDLRAAKKYFFDAPVPVAHNVAKYQRDSTCTPLAMPLETIGATLRIHSRPLPNSRAVISARKKERGLPDVHSPD
jgi:hypothetical protein